MPHTDSAGNAVSVPRGQVPVFARRVRHPGTIEQPYLRPSVRAAQLSIRRRASRIVAIIAKSSTRSAIVKELNRALKIAAFVAQRRARKLAPVDTGRLRGSINVREVNILAFTVGTNVVYAAHVEFGTKPHVIRPRTKQVLHFLVKRQGKATRGRRNRASAGRRRRSRRGGRRRRG